MMRNKPSIDKTDPIAEVRRWRAQVFQEAGSTIKGLIAMLATPENAKTAKTAVRKSTRNGRGRRKRAA